MNRAIRLSFLIFLIGGFCKASGNTLDIMNLLKDESATPYSQILNAWKQASAESIEASDLIGLRVGREFSFNMPSTAFGAYSRCYKKSSTANGPFFPEEPKVFCGSESSSVPELFDEGVWTSTLLQVISSPVLKVKNYAVCEDKSNGEKKCFRKQNDFILYLVIENNGVKATGYYYKLFEMPDPEKLLKVVDKYLWELPVGTKLSLKSDISITEGMKWVNVRSAKYGDSAAIQRGCYFINENNETKSALKNDILTLISAPKVENKYLLSPARYFYEFGKYKRVASLGKSTKLLLEDESKRIWSLECFGNTTGLYIGEYSGVTETGLEEGMRYLYPMRINRNDYEFLNYFNLLNL